jgi:hypothetical protein
MFSLDHGNAVSQVLVEDHGNTRSVELIAIRNTPVGDITVRCPTCKGTGKDPRKKGIGFNVCPMCNGRGTIRKG